MHLSFALFADAANISQEGKLNILGVFDAGQCGNLPTIHPRAHLVVRLKGGQEDVGTHTVSLHWLNPQGNELWSSNGELNIGAPPAGVMEMDMPLIATGISVRSGATSATCVMRPSARSEKKSRSPALHAAESRASAVPSSACWRASRGRATPCCPNTVWIMPEQSAPHGVIPPHWYDVLQNQRAADAQISARPGGKRRRSSRASSASPSTIVASAAIRAPSGSTRSRPLSASSTVQSS